MSERTFAAYEVVDRRREYVPNEIYDRLSAGIRRDLRAAGWRDDAIDELSIDLSISDRHTVRSWQDPRPIADLVVVLGEVRALELTNPNPFPPISIPGGELADTIEGFLVECLATIDALFGWISPSRRRST